ncbi:MAG: ExbD/TolR family protein [Hyphomicrobiales bacterium]
MASTGASGPPGRRRRGGRKHKPIADINMTPFIDVMLVLLIIFMVAAPLLTTGVPLDLPQTGAQSLNLEKQPLVVSVKADGKVFLMETEITLEELVPKLQAVSKAGADDRIYIRGDRTIAYGQVAEVIAALTVAGYRKVALVNEPIQQ